MKILVERIAKRDTYTIGKLWVNGNYECDTIEDKVRDLTKEKKVPGMTAIPSGSYVVRMDIQSPRFRKSEKYARINGCLPRLMNVPYFEGVLMHIGNTASDTEGCLCLGENKVKGQVINSTETFWRVYDKMNTAYKNGEQITIEIR